MQRFLSKMIHIKLGFTCGLISRRMSTVMSFGDGAQGALGLPNSSMGLGFDAYEPSPIPGLPTDISSVAAGHYHSLAITSQGHVWAWGRNEEFQLGRGLYCSRETWNKPQMVEGLNQVAIKAAFASGVVSAAVGEDGSLWVWGKSKRGQLGLGKGITDAVLPTRVEALVGQDILKVSLGWGHSLALTKDGKVFGWGYYADGRLGHVGKSLEASPLDSFASNINPMDVSSKSMVEAAEKLVLEATEKEKDMPIIWEPTLVKELEKVEVGDVACGLDHSLILCNDGSLLSGGSNVYGQLGRVNKNLGLHVVDMKIRPISVASGLGHSLAICKDVSSNRSEEDGVCIASWGWNQSSQLGRDGPENVPKIVDSLADEVALSVSGGRVHSIALTVKREVWTWGSGRNGRLGLGSSTDEAEPMLVDYLEDYGVLQAVAGFDHSLVLIAD